MKRAAVWFACLMIVPPAAVRAEGKRPMNVEDLFRFQRVSDPQISPDGKAVAYVVTSVDLPGNKTSSAIWLASTDRDERRPLTNAPGKKDKHPRWSPYGKHILFESNRSGDSQLWVIDVAGGEARQLTTVSTEANTGIWSPDGKRVAFVSAVWPEYSEKPFKESDALNKKRKEDTEKSPVKARVFTKLFYRHWDEWVEDKRKHLFVLEVATQAHGLQPVGEPQDVTPGDRDAYPTSDTFETGDNFTFSPDGSHLVFTAVPAKDEAWSTNYDICRVPVTGGTKEWECLTKDNPAADSGPKFSPDGKRLAYRAQKRPGFEADRWELMLVDTDRRGTFQGRPRSLTAKFDSGVDEFAWLATWAVLFHAEKEARKPPWEVSLDGGEIRAAEPELGVHWGTSSGISVSDDTESRAWLVARMDMPPAIYRRGQGPVIARSINPNKHLLEELDLPRPESVTVKGAGGTPMQMWVLKPPGFDPSKKWPLAFLVHGGPQSAWEDGWSYRWNAQLWAAQGYVVALPNPRGSTGFGQKYVDEISGDWGGKCYEDLMAGLAWLEEQPYIDRDRMAAAGASFGGYMMNWFQGHTTKFKTLISHCGVYNFDSMYALTDELWFDEWEHGGPPWLRRDSYEKFSPHRFAKNFRTPMLIIHNDGDFRVPVAEGYQLFTTLQRLGVPSKMINFTDETHWVLKPANSERWHREVFAWLKKYVPPGGR
jgi:dipeptidyl aminopeptidase/acylaminoacyl peptidase